MWLGILRAFTWLSTGYLVNDATRTIGQVTDTGDYHEPAAPSGTQVVADVKEKSIFEKVALWVTIIGGLFVIYEFVRKYQK